MIMIPFPFVVAELVIFFLAVQEWGFLNTLGYYLLPCLLGFLIMTTVGRVALMSLQTSMMRGQQPGNKILHSGALFLSGLLFIIPSFFARVVAVVLFLPGLRHLAVWRFKVYMAKKMSQGSARVFNFGGGPFGFGAGMGGMGNGQANNGFRYYDFRNQGGGFEEVREEREIQADVLDVTPLEITHEDKEGKKDS